MRILAIAPEPFFSPRGTPLSVYYRTLVLSQLGHQVDLLTYGQGDEVELEGVRIKRIPSFSRLGPVPVGPSLLKLFLDSVLTIKLLGLLLVRRYDVVDAHEESVFLARWLKPLFRYKLIYDMHSSLPQQLTNFRFTRSRVLIKAFELLENSSLKSAEAVITISPALAEYATAIMPNRDRHFLIENTLCDEIRLVDRADITAEVESWQRQIPSDRAVIGYAGTLEPYQGIDLLLEAFARIESEVPSAHLMIIGGNQEQVSHYRRQAEGYGLRDRCLFTGIVPIGVARALTRSATVLTSPRITGNNTPLKIYELLAGDTPFVATRIVAHTQVLTEDVCFLADPEPDDFARAVVDALTDSRLSSDKSKAANELYDRNYSRAEYVEKMRAMLAAVE